MCAEIETGICQCRHDNEFETTKIASIEIEPTAWGSIAGFALHTVGRVVGSVPVSCLAHLSQSLGLRP